MNMVRICPLLAWTVIVPLALSACDKPLSPPGVCSNALGTETPLSTDAILADMLEPSEAAPHGVPEDYPWYAGATYNDLATMSAGELAPYQAITGWGLVYMAAEGHTAVNTRVQIRHLQAWYKTKSSGAWQLASPGVVDVPDGALFPEDMTSSSTKPSDYFEVSEELGGGISAVPDKGRAFHYFPPRRQVVALSEMEAVFATVQARLVVADPSRAEDCNQARLLQGTGLDAYPDESTSLQIAPEIAEGRMRLLTPDWEWVSTYYAPNMDPALLDTLVAQIQ